MLHDIIKHIILGAIISGIGFTLVATGNRIVHHDIAEFIILVGIAWALVNILIVLYKKKVSPSVNKALNDKAANQAQDELLKLKKLLDEGIITQSEYNQKSDKLKALALK